jgi:hypothetical protein
VPQQQWPKVLNMKTNLQKKCLPNALNSCTALVAIEQTRVEYHVAIVPSIPTQQSPELTINMVRLLNLTEKSRMKQLIN